MFIVHLMGARTDNNPSERTSLGFMEAERYLYKGRRPELPFAKFKTWEQRLVKRIKNHPPLMFLNEPAMLDLCRSLVKCWGQPSQSFQKIIASRSVLRILALCRKPIRHDFTAIPESQKFGSGSESHISKK